MSCRASTGCPSGRTSYTASVGNDVAQISVVPEVSHDGAALAYLDDGDDPIADADTNTAGHQVSLAEGLNAINIRVTAQDGVTTGTYTLDVTRATVSGNNLATGRPAITGTTQVGQTLAAGIGTIGDDDGLPSNFPDDYTFQWERVDEDGSNPQDIADATGPTYTLAAADQGKRVKVKVAFTDEADNAEERTSQAYPASGTVAAATPPTPDPLTASFEDVPAQHDGSTPFKLRLAFSSPVGTSYRVLRDQAVTATGGTVTGASRVDRRSDLWEITVAPSGAGPVTVTLAATAPCGEPGALCTSDGRALTNAPSVTVQGRSSLSVADAEVEEGPNAVLAFAVTLSPPSSGTVTVAYRTADGEATAGQDYTTASGTLTFLAGETAKTVSVAVLDDSHDEGNEVVMLLLSNPSGAYLVDRLGIGTITNTDPMPRGLMARFGRAMAVQVVEHVEARLQAPRELAGNVLSQLGASVGAATRGLLHAGGVGYGQSVDVELGRNIALGEAVTLTPRAWAVGSRVSVDDFTDAVDSRASFPDADRLLGGVGTVVEATRAWERGSFSLRGSVDAERMFSGAETLALVSGERLRLEGATDSLLVGLNAAYRQSQFSLGAKVWLREGLDANAREYAGVLNIGVRF